MLTPRLIWGLYNEEALTQTPLCHASHTDRRNVKTVVCGITKLRWMQLTARGHERVYFSSRASFIITLKCLLTKIKVGRSEMRSCWSPNNWLHWSHDH